MDRLRSIGLVPVIGWIAGIALLAVIALAVTPPLVVRYQVHAFSGKLHAGMSAADVQSSAASMHLDATEPRADEIAVTIRPAYTFGSACSNDYVIVVTLERGRVERWRPIREQLCVKT